MKVGDKFQIGYDWYVVVRITINAATSERQWTIVRTRDAHKTS